MDKIAVQVSLTGRDELNLILHLNAKGEIESSQLLAIGCLNLLKQVRDFRVQLRGELSKLPCPQGIDHASLMLRELVLRAQGKWNPPYQEEELCHCRVVPTVVVEEAIISGAHTTAEVSRLTSAGTSCGTCRPDTESLIEYRLKTSAK